MPKGSVDINYVERIPNVEVAKIHGVIKTIHGGSVSAEDIRLKSIRNIQLTAIDAGSIPACSISTRGSLHNYATINIVGSPAGSASVYFSAIGE